VTKPLDHGKRERRFHWRRAICCSVLLSWSAMTVALPVGVVPISRSRLSSDAKWSSHRSRRGWNKGTVAAVSGSIACCRALEGIAGAAGKCKVAAVVVAASGEWSDVFYFEREVECRRGRVAIFAPSVCPLQDFRIEGIHRPSASANASVRLAEVTSSSLTNPSSSARSESVSVARLSSKSCILRY
jgi:hypothetical protein